MSASILNVKELLSWNLSIPNYQRPYKWTQRNVAELLEDLKKAIEDSAQYKDFKYRIGSVILYKNKDGVFEVVDGQQRLITLTLVSLCVGLIDKIPLMDSDFKSKISQINIKNNYKIIKDWFFNQSKYEERFIKAMEQTFQFVVVVIEGDISQAFQLFDSQNHRGKPLDPHALLKAYHLREMQSKPYEMALAVNRWEEKSPDSIRKLFSDYLFPIWNWTKNRDSIPFTSKEIDAFKGVYENSSYSYAKRAFKASPYFQITEPFVAGKDFFDYVDHYLNLLTFLKDELQQSDVFKDIAPYLKDRRKRESKYYNKTDLTSSGYIYSKNLFYCALLCYYDRFHNLNRMTVIKLFSWAFMLRIDRESLGDSSVNIYAKGEAGFSNRIAMFSKILFARQDAEIANLLLNVKTKSDSARVVKWNNLYHFIKELNGEG